MRARPVVFLFSGQGSHYYQMGRELFECNATFREYLNAADAAAREQLGMSVLQEVFNPQRRKSDLFDRTLLTHPAIVMVEWALANTLIDAGIEPDYLLGASLGSFAAAALADSLSMEDALAAAIAHARAIEQHCPAGGMSAVLATARRCEALAAQFDGCELAAVNFDTHCAIAGPVPALAAAEAQLRKADVGCQRLAVSRPFHSRWVDPAEQPWRTAVSTLSWRPARVPVLCGSQSVPPATLDADSLWRATRNPIRFPEPVLALEQRGPCHYIDLGPAGTLATFLKYLLPQTSTSDVHAVLTLAGQDSRSLQRVLQAFA